MNPTTTQEPRGRPGRAATKDRVPNDPVPAPLSAAAEIVRAYCAGVLDGTVPAGELIRLCVQRHLDDLQHGPARGLRFDQGKADAAVAFFSYLKHSKGEWAGQAFALAPWQVFILSVLFGWLKSDGSRRYRTAYVELPRKNGKSTMGAGVGLKLAFADDEPGAEVYSAATKKDQAAIVHGEAMRMVKATPALDAKIQSYKHSLSREAKHQTYLPLGADEDTLDGLNVHAAIVDELHAHKTRGVFDLMESGTSARRQPMLFVITTAGTDQSATSICWEQHIYGEQLLRKIIEDDSYFVFISALDDKDAWDDERSWYKANPNLGISKKVEYMREQARKAKNMPSKLNSFLRLDLNRWTQQVTRWIDMTLWDENAGAGIDENALAGRPCYGGLDLSSVSDLTAWVMLFPDPIVTDRLQVLVRLWCPQARLHDETNRYRDQYQAWERLGWLRVTPGNAIDYEAIEKQIAEDAEQFNILEVAIDRLFQGYQTAMRLQDHLGLTVAACGMGYMSMAGPCKEFERRLLGRHLQHGGNPILKWMANNVAVRQDPAGNLKPDKDSSQGKIDGIVGILLALDRVMRQAQASVYESRGVRVLGGGRSNEGANPETQHNG